MAASEHGALLQMTDLDDDDGDITAAGLEFQNFAHSSSSPTLGASSSSTKQAATYTPPPRIVPATTVGSEWDGAASAPAGMLPQHTTAGAPGANAGNPAFYSLEYYMKYFDVDTAQVLGRMGHSMLPWKPRFFEELSPNPDMYGPFWVATTLVFILFVSGNLSGSIIAYIQGVDFEPDFSRLSWAATAVYIYVFVFPLALYFAFRWYSIPAKLVELWCLYGYAMTVFIPVAILSVLPFDWFKWLLCAYALLSSGVFMGINLWPLASGAEAKSGLLFIVLALLAHAGMTLLFKFVFFSYSISYPSPTEAQPTTIPTTASSMTQ